MEYKKKHPLGFILNEKANEKNRKILEQCGVNFVIESPTFNNEEMTLKVMENLPFLENAIDKYYI